MHGVGRRAATLLAGAWLFLAAAAGAQAPPSEGSGGSTPLDPVFDVEVLNEGLAGGAPEGALRTPRSALSYFLDRGAGQRYAAAAHALNLNGVPVAEQDDLGLELARQLHFVLERAVDLDWPSIPDRPDGLVDADAGAGNGTTPPQARRSLLLDTVPVEGRPAEIRLERLSVDGQDPVWVISRSTVALTDALYARYGPGWLDRVLPQWARVSVAGVYVWQWAALALVTLLGIALGIASRRLASLWAKRTEAAWPRRLMEDVGQPLAALVAVSFLWVVQGTLFTVRGEAGRWVGTLMTVALIAALTWTAVRAVLFVAEDIGRGRVQDLANVDVRRYRQRETMVSVARRTFIFAALLLGGGVLLSQFEVFRSVGTSLLASAGVLGVVLGIAAQSSLGNLVAGLQLAVTQPVRIGDTVYFDDTWSYVEEITYTYTVIRTWDRRRLIIPNQQMVTRTVENWDVTDSDLAIMIFLYVDYRTSVDAVRRRYLELVEEIESWSEAVEPSLVVAEARPDVLQLRAMVSAADPAQAWTQSCWLREELVRFLQESGGGLYLPQQRLLVETLPAAEAPHGDAESARSEAAPEGHDRSSGIGGATSGGPGPKGPPEASAPAGESADEDEDPESEDGGEDEPPRHGP